MTTLSVMMSFVEQHIFSNLSQSDLITEAETARPALSKHAHELGICICPVVLVFHPSVMQVICRDPLLQKDVGLV